MVDVAAKAATHRIALASGRIEMQPATLAVIQAGTAKKGDVLGIARIAGINAGAMTRVIDSLVERNLVERKSHPSDRRVWLIDFTKQGEALWSTIDHCGKNVLKAAFRDIPKKEQQQFEQTLLLIIDNLQDIPEGKE